MPFSLLQLPAAALPSASCKPVRLSSRCAIAVVVLLLLLLLSQGGVVGAECSSDAVLLASRLELVQAELEGERAAHRREMRKKVREVQEVRADLVGCMRAA